MRDRLAIIRWTMCVLFVCSQFVSYGKMGMWEWKLLVNKPPTFQGKMEIQVSTTVRVWDFILLTNQQVRLLQFHLCWQKTRDPGSKTKNFVTHGNRSSQNINIFIYLYLEPPSLEGDRGKGPGDTCTHSVLCY